MDSIRIKDLEVYGHHGVLPEENKLGQKFLVTVELFLDISKAGNIDNLKYAVNYAEVAHHIKDFLERQTFQLIEAAAEQLAKSILLDYKPLKSIKLEIKKPWAPILLPLDVVSVVIERKWHTVYLSIGSNMGDREGNLKSSIQLLKKDRECEVLSVSDFMASKPVGEVVQDDFLNGVVELKTLRSPERLLDLIEEIERELKRKRTVHWGPRTIDLDIIFYDDLVMRSERLIIPHKEMQKRLFVLEPLAQLAPERVHPILKQNVMELLLEMRK